MGLDLEYSFGQTPINEEEKEGLKIVSITNKKQLDEFEQWNIEEAIQWLTGRNITSKQLFSEEFLCGLHKRMFGNIWNWAGIFRKSEKNIGVASYQISIQLKVLCDDARFWMENDTYSPDELAIRFKHRLVSIHCFSNGNGRHSRLVADAIIEKLFRKEPFSWGSAGVLDKNNIRKNYLSAVKQADNNDFQPLIEFARS